MKKMVAFLFCETEEEFKIFFQNEFIGHKITYKGIPITFAEDDFSHICYEAGTGGISKTKFGIRRARRLLIVKQMLLEEIPSELFFEESTGNYLLLCETLDMVVFLIPVKKYKTLQIGTIIHYGQGFTKAIEKQKNKSQKVETIEF